MIPHNQRRAPAQHLTNLMREKRTSVERLANKAMVTQFHVEYMRNFATKWHQVAYLGRVLDRLEVPATIQYDSRVEFKLPVDDELHRMLKERAGKKSLNSTIISILEQEP
jgi:hypothetical protein